MNREFSDVVDVDCAGTSGRAWSRPPCLDRVSGLQAAQVRRRCMRVRLRTWSRTSSGAATMVLWSCCRAARRHLIAVFRVVRSHQGSTVPERSLATWTRRQCARLGRRSHPRSLPLALRLAGSGPVTSSTGIPESARCRVDRWIPLLHEAARESGTSEASGSRLGWWRTIRYSASPAAVRSWWVSTPPMTWMLSAVVVPAPWSMMGGGVGSELSRCRTRQ